jgi:hypothetical protein
LNAGGAEQPTRGDVFPAIVKSADDLRPIVKFLDADRQCI